MYRLWGGGAVPETPNCETPGVSTISRPLALQAPRSEAVRQHSVALLRQKAYDAERETLEEAVGRPPARSWKEEWVPLQLQHLRLRAVAAGPEAVARLKAILTPDVLAEITRDWQPGGEHDVESCLRDASSVSVGWKEAQGWPRERAEAYTLLASTFKAVLGHAVRNRSSVSLVRLAIRAVLTVTLTLSSRQP